MRRRNALPKPNEVFVPAGLPLKDVNVYATREVPEDSLSRYLTRSQIPVVFGEYGVGKTTLVRRFLRESEAEERLVYISSAAGKSLSDIVKRVLEHLNYEIEVERTEGQRYQASAGFNAYLVQAKGDVTAEDGRRVELAVSSPTDARIIRLMATNQLALVIDEMHKASPELRAELADFIKSVRGENDSYPQIVLIGTTLDAENLVRQDPGIDRFVKELLVSPLHDDEARYIVETGFRDLQLTVEEELVETVIRTAAGAPTIVQEVCLNMAECAVRSGQSSVNRECYMDAVRTYLWDHGRRLASTYVKSIEQTGPRRYRKQVLLAMANLQHDFVNMDDISSQVSRQLAEDIPSTALSGPLRALKTGEDSILQDVERQAGDRVYNLSAFRDPMMKSFIRFMDEIEAQGVLAPDQMRQLAAD